MKIEWTEKRLQKLKEVSSMTKIPRYFAIKHLVEETIDEEIDELREILDIAKKKLYPYQDDKERLDIIIEKLAKMNL